MENMPENREPKGELTHSRRSFFNWMGRLQLELRLLVLGLV